jgi:hypothetical protein
MTITYSYIFSDTNDGAVNTTLLHLWKFKMLVLLYSLYNKCQNIKVKIIKLVLLNITLIIILLMLKLVYTNVLISLKRLIKNVLLSSFIYRMCGRYHKPTTGRL